MAEPAGSDGRLTREIMSNTDPTNKDVSRDDLVERINGPLTTDSEDLQEQRMSESPSFGNFYADTNEIAERPGDIDIESIGRELGVLDDDETYAESTADPDHE
jgi:hypothetical protein